MPGGLGVSELAYQEACARSGLIEPRFTPYSRRSDTEGPFGLAVRLVLDFLAFIVHLIRDRPDVVHLNTAYDRRALGRDLGYMWVAALVRQPMFLKLHGSDAALLAGPSPIWRWMTRQVIGRAAAIGVLSSEEKANFVAAGFDAARFQVVKNVVDWRRFQAGEASRPAGAPLLFIARFIPAKGLMDVIRALHRLRVAGHDVRLTCVGDGPQRGEAEALVTELGLTGAVDFTGQVPETTTTAFYQRSVALVFPTRHPEGFSMTIFQALAAGLPILTTRIRAAADYLKEPDNVLWVEASRPEALAERIGWLLDHPEAAAAMSRNNMARAHDFDGETLVREFLSIYRTIAQVGGRA